jgi:hypothetical protein
MVVAGKGGTGKEADGGRAHLIAASAVRSWALDA